MPTIKDVAERAQVSIATVSRVLNASGYVSPELDQRVRAAIADLGYTPNMVARNLRRSESVTLGLLIPDSSNPFFAEVARGVEEVCFDRGFTLVMCNTAENADKAATYINNLYQHRIAGFIIVATGQLAPFLQQLQEENRPFVLVDRPVSGIEADMVVSDNREGGKQALQHLLALGHRRIGFIANASYLETARSRWLGALDALTEAGQVPMPELIYSQGDFSPQSGYAGAQYLLEQPDPPTAVFALNDLMAYGVLNYAATHGIPVPEQLSVVGFDDIVMSAYTVPSLTTIAQPKIELGRVVSELLLRRIEGDTQPPVYLSLPTQLIVRQSTAALC